MSYQLVRTDPKKLTAVRDFPEPMNVKTLRSVLGLASYYRRFVPNFAKVARPLHALTGKDRLFVWTPDCQAAFEELKCLLTSSPVLSYPDFQKPFVLETDRQALDWVQYLDNDKKMAPSDPSRIPVVHCKSMRHAMALLAWASCGPSSTSVHTSLATRARHPCKTLRLCLASILDIGYALQ